MIEMKLRDDSKDDKTLPYKNGFALSCYGLDDKWKVNPNEKVANGVINAILRNDGLCPCVNDSKNTHCPCTNLQEKGKCCCGLYVEK